VGNIKEPECIPEKDARFKRIIDGIKIGSQSDFDAFSNEFYPIVRKDIIILNKKHGKTLTEEDEDDICQDFWGKLAVRNRNGKFKEFIDFEYHDYQRLHHWLFIKVRNGIADHIRLKDRGRAVMVPIDESGIDEFPRNDPDPLEALLIVESEKESIREKYRRNREIKQLKDKFKHAINELPDLPRWCAKLKFIKYFGYIEKEEITKIAQYRHRTFSEIEQQIEGMSTKKRKGLLYPTNEAIGDILDIDQSNVTRAIEPMIEKFVELYGEADYIKAKRLLRNAN
jgi:DNA-directed RNA polymerase specialized sigma24 family protein